MRAADFLQVTIGAGPPFVQWTAARPDALLPGDVSAYTLHEGLVDGLIVRGGTNVADVAHFMCELVTNPETWEQWKAGLPVVVNAAEPSVAAPRAARAG